ncbi:MAG: hypothetical protein AAGC55_24040, partial [Myxococcota bacterium]
SSTAVTYQFEGLTRLSCVQHLLAAFRTPKIKSLELEIVDHDVLTIVVHSESGDSLPPSHLMRF